MAIYEIRRGSGARDGSSNGAGFSNQGTGQTSGMVRGSNQSTINFDQGNIRSNQIGINTSTPVGFQTAAPFSQGLTAAVVEGGTPDVSVVVPTPVVVTPPPAPTPPVFVPSYTTPAVTTTPVVTTNTPIIRDLQGSNSQGVIPLGDSAPVRTTTSTTTQQVSVPIQPTITRSGITSSPSVTTSVGGGNNFNPLPQGEGISNITFTGTTTPAVTTPVVTTTTNTGGFLAGNNNAFGGDTFVETTTVRNQSTAGTTGFGGNNGPSIPNVGISFSNNTNTTDLTPPLNGPISFTENNSFGVRGSNQATIFFDQQGNEPSDQVGMNVPAVFNTGGPVRQGPQDVDEGGFGGNSSTDVLIEGDSGGGSSGGSNIGTNKNFVEIVTLYGPYPNECAAYDGKKTAGRVGVWTEEDFGDTFEVNRFYGSLVTSGGFLAGNDNPFGGDTFTPQVTTRAEFNGGNQWYYDNSNGTVIRIGSNGANVEFKSASQLATECTPVIQTGPHTLQLRFNFGKGTNHPSSNSQIKVNGSVVSSTGGFKTYNITLPYRNGTSTLYTIQSLEVGSRQPSSIYRVDRVTLNGRHTIKVYKNNQLNQESSFVDNSDKTPKKSNASFNLSFDYEIVVPPNFLLVTPSQGITNNQSGGQYFIDVVSSHSGGVTGIPSWAEVSTIFNPAGYGTTKNFRIVLANAPNKLSPNESNTREATLVFRHGNKTQEHRIVQRKGEYVEEIVNSASEIKIDVKYSSGRNGKPSGTVISSGVSQWNGSWGRGQELYRGFDIPVNRSTRESTIAVLQSEDSISTWKITIRYSPTDDIWLVKSKKSNDGILYQDIETKEYVIKFDGEDEYITERNNDIQFELEWDNTEIINNIPTLLVQPSTINVPATGGQSGTLKAIGQFLTSPISVISAPSWLQNLRVGSILNSGELYQLVFDGNPPGQSSRVGTIVIESSNITRTITINQAAQVVVPIKDTFTLSNLKFNYTGGNNAGVAGRVDVEGAPSLIGVWGTGSKTYTSSFTLKRGIAEATLANWSTPSVTGKQSLTRYVLVYNDNNGDFTLTLRRQIGSEAFIDVETKRFQYRGSGASSNGSSAGSGIGASSNDLVALDGYTWNTLSFDFTKKDIPPNEDIPPSLRLQTNINEVWATVEVYDPVSKTTILQRDVAKSLFINGSTLGLGNQSSYQVKIVKRTGYIIEDWSQTSPTSLTLDKNKLNTFIILEGDDTKYDWIFNVKRQSPPNKVIDVYPSVNSIEYNLNDSGDRVEIPYTSSKDTDYVNVKLPNGQEKKNLSKNGKFTLDKSFFDKGLGRYTIIFCSYGADGTRGGEKSVVINVISKEEGFYPDIRDIRFPERINGADFAGLNVPFSFSYKSVFTDYVKVYLHDKDTRIDGNFSKVDTVKLNVQDLVNMSGKYVKSGDKYTFTFLLVPFAQQGSELLEGKTEKIKIIFDEGDLKLDRNKVIKDLCDSFAANLDYESFDDYISTYLTHLLHFGDTNNEVISNWEADTETFRKYKVDPVTKRETNEQEEGGFDSLVLKLYEPLETTVQPNQQVWITKVQSKPQLHEVIIRESSEESCPPLAGPNFSLVNNSNMGYELLDDMVASGSESNIKLVNAFVSKSGIDTDKLDIQYVSGSIVYDKTSDSYLSSSQRIYWENFSHFGSSEERVKNFYYKASLIENYENISASLSSGDYSTSLSVVREREEQVIKISKLENAFDGFEKFLYENTSSLSYPKDSNGKLLGTGSAEVLSWLNVTEVSASIHDVENKNYLANNIPQYVKNDRENDDFILFLDMIGHHFDILWTYVEALNRQRRLEHKLTSGVSDDMVKEMLKSFGYTPNTTLDTAPLWEFALGQYNKQNSSRTDGKSKSAMTGKDRQNQIWRRILNNLPYLYKSKGTSRGLKATLSTYGIPETFLSVREFGGPHPEKGKTQKLTTVEQSFAAKLEGSSKIIVPWHGGSPYPHTIEVSVSSEKQQDGTIFKTDGMELKMFKDTGSLAHFEFHISGSGNIISASTDTIPFFNDTYTSFMISRQYTSGSTHEGFDIYVKEPFQQRIRSQVSASVSASYGETSWESGSELIFEGYSASIDNIKLWKTALSESIFDEHVLAPDMYNGNSISSSTEDLYFRLDFEVGENFAVSSSFSPSGSYKNTAPNLDLYGSTFATMSNFDSSSTYPYGGLSVIEKEITITVPNTGLADADKIRISKQTLLSELSPKARATKSALKEKPIDSNKIGMFISPTKNVNLDIIKAMGSTFSIDDFIGDPRDIYEEEYTDLKNFRKSFFSKYTLNYDAFYNLIKYVDNSLFQALKSQAPSRSKVVTGLLIEPHILERNKRQRKKPSGIVFESLVGTEDISKNSIIEISSENIPFEGILSASNLQRPSGEQTGYETTIDYNFVENLSGSNNSYESTIDYDFVNNLSGSQLSYESTIDYDFVNNLTAENSIFQTVISEDVRPTFSTQSVDASGNNNLSIIFEVSGSLDSNTSGEYVRDNIVPSQDSDISKLGYGVTAKDGHAIVTFLTPNGRRKERRKYYLITEEVTRKVKVLNISGDQSSGYKTVNETENVKKLTYVSISGSAPSVTGSITEVQPINGNLPSHYIYVKDTSTGLENSFFNGCKQTQATTIDGGPAFETFVTNPNTLKVSDSGRGSGEPILEVE